MPYIHLGRKAHYRAYIISFQLSKQFYPKRHYEHMKQEKWCFYRQVCTDLIKVRFQIDLKTVEKMLFGYA